MLQGILWKSIAEISSFFFLVVSGFPGFSSRDIVEIMELRINE